MELVLKRSPQSQPQQPAIASITSHQKAIAINQILKSAIALNKTHPTKVSLKNRLDYTHLEYS